LFYLRLIAVTEWYVKHRRRAGSNKWYEMGERKNEKKTKEEEKILEVKVTGANEEG
jgi:hypothetical protein